MKAIDAFEEMFPFPTNEDKTEKAEWYTELGSFQIGWDAHAKETDKRLTLARELIAVLSHNGMMPENMMVDGGKAWQAWKDGETQ